MLDASDTTRDNVFEFITFSAGSQSFCLDIMRIREIRRWTPVTALPHTPTDVLGVMNLRGAVIPIFDLAARFDLGKTEENERNVVIVASVGKNIIGLLVEAVSEILSVAVEDIQNTPDLKSDATQNCIQGVISIDNHLVRVINLDAVLGSETGAAA